MKNKCEKHNEEKRLIGCDYGKLIYRCESCLEEQLKGLAEDVAELEELEKSERNKR